MERDFFEKQQLCDLNFDALTRRDDYDTVPVCLPDEEYSFLHEAAGIAYHGRIFAAWYQNKKAELRGETPIFWTHSDDGGKTFAKKRLLAVDPTGAILFCPPVFGICHDRLYMLINEMAQKPDHIHALDLYIYHEETDAFEFLWSKPIPFKLNTNVVAMDNGKLLLPGRIGELDSFPDVPAVLISDSGEIDGDWRLVKMQEDHFLPDGSHFVHPEQTAIVDKNRITMFCRTDDNILPVLFVSEDYGETWSLPILYDVPVSNSKIYAGTLSDGRNYWIGSAIKGREKLCLLVTKPGEKQFTAGCLLQDGPSEQFPGSGLQWSYPVAFEDRQTLYAIYTASLGGEDQAYRGAVLTKIPFDRLPE